MAVIRRIGLLTEATSGRICAASVDATERSSGFAELPSVCRTERVGVLPKMVNQTSKNQTLYERISTLTWHILSVPNSTRSM